MAGRWPAQVKQNQSAAARRHLKELGQGGDGLVLDAGALRLTQGGACTERVPLGPGWGGAGGRERRKGREKERRIKTINLPCSNPHHSTKEKALKVFF